jgi:hypothetical protein
MALPTKSACSATLTVIGLLGLLASYRFDARADAPADRYIVTDDTVTDRQTGLEWQRSVEDGVYLLWNDAVSYCQKLGLAGGGWRLPAFKELLTLVDPTRVDPAFDLTAFPAPSRRSPPNNGADLVFWTASPSVRTPDFAWAVYFDQGYSGDTSSRYAARARCVR